MDVHCKNSYTVLIMCDQACVKKGYYLNNTFYSIYGQEFGEGRCASLVTEHRAMDRRSGGPFPSGKTIYCFFSFAALALKLPHVVAKGIKHKRHPPKSLLNCPVHLVTVSLYFYDDLIF